MTQPLLRRPTIEDGPRLHALVAECPPLDRNSRYCNLLQATHFGDTAVVAEQDGQLVGMVTGYRMPGRRAVLFVWQVAVAPAGRGQGLAARMLDHLLERLPDIRHVETTVTLANGPSTALFEGLAERHGAALERSVLFERDRDFAGAQDDEVLFRIGPLSSADAADAADATPLSRQETHAA